MRLHKVFSLFSTPTPVIISRVRVATLKRYAPHETVVLPASELFLFCALPHRGYPPCCCCCQNSASFSFFYPILWMKDEGLTMTWSRSISKSLLYYVGYFDFEAQIGQKHLRSSPSFCGARLRTNQEGDPARKAQQGKKQNKRSSQNHQTETKSNVLFSRLSRAPIGACT